jgi:hypothetical protein
MNLGEYTRLLSTAIADMERVKLELLTTCNFDAPGMITDHQRQQAGMGLAICVARLNAVKTAVREAFGLLTGGELNL